MNPPKNVHDALRHIDNLLADILRTIDEYTEERMLANIPEQLKQVCGSAADARLLAVWVRDQLKEKQA
jgi:hypothetical protein